MILLSHTLHSYKIRCSSRLLMTIIFFTAIACQQKAETKAISNRLAKASSPYLREHSDNPVDWYEWSEEALEKAKLEDKPIIISIGYASCHWCHVMEEETFMDTVVARMMNENFVSIKIDREERPDIDQIYITASQLINGNAGWPLNAIALPDTKPFYAGTYFTKEQWLTLLSQIVNVYHEEANSLVKQAEAITHGILTDEMIMPSVSDSKNEIQGAYEKIFSGWESKLDFQYGGLSEAPKFPMPVAWEFLLQNFYHTHNKKALDIVTTTLDEMAKGGIYDPLDGGFARYSTDDQWKVPHFEKMLYDNGQLISLYAHAFQVTKDSTYYDVVKETLDFIKTEMTSPGDGFYSSLNADSEGEEGTFYVWTKSEIESILDQKASGIFIDFYNITEEGNWENNKNVLYKKNSLDEIATKHKITKEQIQHELSRARMQLAEVRKKREKPSLDDKILTSWNALMLSGYLDAYWAFGNPEYLKAATANGEFLKINMVREGGQLWRSYSNNRASIDAFLDDYALLANAFIHLYQATFDMEWLKQARSIANYAVLHFKDESTGFFYYTSDASNLIVRKMEIADHVMPSSNSVMAEVLFKLGQYYSDEFYLKTSNNMIQHVSPEMVENGPYRAHWASLLGTMNFRQYEIAIMGDSAHAISKELMKNYLPNVLLMGGTTENLPLLENKYVADKNIIYVCHDKVCKLPVTEVEMALKQMGK